MLQSPKQPTVAVALSIHHVMEQRNPCFWREEGNHQVIAKVVSMTLDQSGEADPQAN